MSLYNGMIFYLTYLILKVLNETKNFVDMLVCRLYNDAILFFNNNLLKRGFKKS